MCVRILALISFPVSLHQSLSGSVCLSLHLCLHLCCLPVACYFSLGLSEPHPRQSSVFYFHTLSVPTLICLDALGTDFLCVFFVNVRLCLCMCVDPVFLASLFAMTVSMITAAIEARLGIKGLLGIKDQLEIRARRRADLLDMDRRGPGAQTCGVQIDKSHRHTGCRYVSDRPPQELFLGSGQT